MRILHLEHNVVDAELIREILTAEFPACAITVTDSRDGFLAGIAAVPAPDLILSDYSLPGFSGNDALALARGRAPGIPFVLLSGSIGEQCAIEAVRTGAYDYVLKNNLARLPTVIRRAIDDFAQRRHRQAGDRRLVELAGVIERATEAIVVADMAGRITLWNEGAARLYGIQSSDAVGRVAEELWSPNVAEHFRAARLATLETGEWSQELSVTTRDNRNLLIDFRMTLVRDVAGEPTARLTIASDITAKKKIEEHFLRVQRLEGLGMLAAGIAHDLKNVLTPVLMSASLLRHRATAVEDVRLLDVLEKSAQRGSALVGQILGFAHGTGGGFRLTQAKPLLRDICEVFEASFPKSIRIEETVGDDLWPICANPTQIHQILLNLAVNARDAMLPQGGTLRVRAENRHLDERAAAAIDGAKPGAFLVVEVSDTGTGMTVDVLARIWDPFFTTKGEGKGTGLGLATARGIAAGHGGFITVATRVGHGTTFSVFLPADKQAVEQGAAKR